MVTWMEKYKALPESKAVPDEIWDLDRRIAYIQDMELRIKIETLQLLAEYDKILAVLRKDWSDAELQQAGFLEGRR